MSSYFRTRPRPRLVPNPPPQVKIGALDKWGWGGFFGQLVVAFGFLIFGLAHFAFANRQFGSDYVSNAKYEQAKTASISGHMSWINGVGTLKDAASGMTYTLVNSDGLK